MAGSISLTLCTPSAVTFIPKATDAVSAVRRNPAWADVSGCRTTATCSTAGAISLSVCSHLPPISGSKIGEAGDVASRMREAFDKTPTDWIRNLQEHDRLVASCVADRLERGVGHRKDEIRPRRDCFFRVDAHALNITIGEAIIDLDIAPHGPSKYLKPLAQC